MATGLESDESILARRVRTIVRMRWVGVLFALLQVQTYATMPYPAGVRETAVGVVALMALTNVAFEVWSRRAVAMTDVRRLALAVLVADTLLLSGIVWIFSFDNLSALFAVLFLLPIEGAVLFGFPGAMWTWGAVSVLYTAREVFGTRYGNPFEPDSVTFRLGLIGIVAAIVGLLVRDLVAARHAVADALEEAQKTEASRSRLISMLAHDVRAPIAGARSAFDTIELAGDRIDIDRRKDLLVAGRRQADRALLLARDLLDLARVEAGTLQLERKPVAVGLVVHNVQEVIGDRAEIRVDVGQAVVVVDPFRLEQVLYNLIDNAAKYGAPPIEIGAERVGDEVRVSVRDHGVGVPDGIDLFTAFSHAGEGSVGLGMWIVQQLVEANAGRVEYEDASPGARFVVTLPAGDVVEGDAAPGATAPA